MYSTDQWSAMLCGWEGNRMPESWHGVAVFTLINAVALQRTTSTPSSLTVTSPWSCLRRYVEATWWLCWRRVTQTSTPRVTARPTTVRVHDSTTPSRRRHGPTQTDRQTDTRPMLYACRHGRDQLISGTRWSETPSRRATRTGCSPSTASPGR